MKDTCYVAFRYHDKTLVEVRRLVKADFSRKTFLVCCANNETVGYAILGSVKRQLGETRKRVTINDNYAYGFGLGLHSSHRGKGLGLRLERYPLEFAKKEGYPCVHVDVFSGNTVSLNLQKKIGFRKLAEHALTKRGKNRNVVFVKRF